MTDGWFMDALKSIFGGKLPDGSAGVAAGVSTPVPSFYSVAADRAAAVAKLRMACDTARLNPAWRPTPGVTHCNGNADQVAQFFGYMKLAGLLADAQIFVLSTDPDWVLDTPQRLSEHALKGGLGFATVVEHPHGHLAPGYPEPAQPSASWGGLEPMLSNVGTTVGVVKMSGAFLLSQKPMVRCYLYKPGEVA